MIGLSALVLVGCNSSMMQHNGAPDAMKMQTAGKVAVATIKPAKAAATMPSNQDVTGTVTFTEETGGRVKVTAHIMGLAPNTEHGFHIHASGDLSAPDLSSAGGHFNPEGHQHGAPGAMSHAGDMGNIKADGTGMAMVDMTIGGVSIGSGAKNDIVGKSVIIHGGVDDLKSQPAGNAGPRVAGGVIELQK
jgi:Cu-Zn family superoxide dismutase